MAAIEDIFECNDDELIPPEWINEEFLKNVLENMKDFDKDAKISTFTIRPACRKGDHYASIMFRATIECTRETSTKGCSILQVIIKTRPPLDTPKGRSLSETQIFENEWIMYTQVIPLLEDEWERHGEKVEFAGRLLYATLHPQPVIVLEDLCLAGYDILRGRLFSLSEVESCLRKLAKWHAVSYKLTASSNPIPTITDADAAAAVNAHATTRTNATSKDFKGQDDNVSVSKKQQVTIVSTDAPRTMTNGANALKQMQQGLFKQKSMLRTDYISGSIPHMIAALEQSKLADNDNSAYGDSNNSLEVSLMKLRLLEPNIIAACMSMNDAFVNGICGPIYVLNHGDFHTTNLMIRRQSTNMAAENCEQLQEEDIRFIDFQQSFFGPSVFDLQYLSFTILSKDLRDTKREQLMQYYFEHFLSSLKKLECKRELPTYRQFQEDSKRWRCFELFLVATILPIPRLNTKTQQNVDMNRVFESKEYREFFYRNPDYLNYLRKLLPKYLESGYLEKFEYC